MNLRYELELLAQGRKNLLGLLKPFSVEQLNQVPTGFKNNLVWNLGHIIISQQILCYKNSGLSPVVPAKYIELYRRGTAPEQTVGIDHIEELKNLAIETITKFKQDYQNGMFIEYQSYQSLYGVLINSIEDAVKFNVIHEGIHMGYIMSIRKLITN